MKSNEHILACISGAPSNAKIIRTAAQMAEAFDGTLTALYVKTPNSNAMSRETQDRLQKHLRLAGELGAEIVTVYGEDIAGQIMEYARVARVTKIVLGRSYAAGHALFARQTLTDKLIRYAPGLDIYIIPDGERRPDISYRRILSGPRLPGLMQWGWTALLLLLSTGVGYLFSRLDFTDANIITVYMMGVLLTSLLAKNYLCSAVFSLVSVVLFNFFFTEPRLSLIAYESGYPVTFAIMLVASLITGTLANRLAAIAKHSADAAYRTGLLFRTNRLLQRADSEAAVVATVADRLLKLLSRDLVIYVVMADRLSEGRVFLSSEENDGRAMVTPQEEAVALRALQGRERVGAGTEHMGDALCHYLPVRAGNTVFLVVGIRVGSRAIEPFENSLLTSILGEAALAMENLRNAKEKEQIALLAKNEQLRADLLRSISHDLRTPLTSISGNTENLLYHFEQLDADTRRQLLTDVYDDARWLTALVENLLAITRISEGRMKLSMSPQLVEEVVSEALRHVSRKECEYHITTHYSEELMLAQMDARLISQVIVNLVDNAIKYTPPGSDIVISAHREGDKVAISVADNGPGIPDERKEDVFRMFYTGEHRVVDCRRSLGLGLSLCRSIVEAHGGTLTLTDNTCRREPFGAPHGAVFTFTLIYSEVNLHE